MSEMVTRDGLGAGQDDIRLRFRRSTLFTAGAIAALSAAVVYASWPSKPSVEQLERAIERERGRINPELWEDTDSCMLPLGGVERRACAKVNSLRRALVAAETAGTPATKGDTVSEMMLLASVFVFWAAAFRWSWRRASSKPTPSAPDEQPTVQPVKVAPEQERPPLIIDVTPRVIQIEHHPEDVKEFDRWANDKHAKC